MAIQWNEDLAVGVDSIDEQHKGIFSRIDTLLGAMAQGKGKEEVGTVIRFLSDYVMKHFRAEEELMIRHDYPGYPSQKIEHMQFIKDFSTLKRDFDTQDVTSHLVIQAQHMLCDWLRCHIETEDKKLGAFLKMERRLLNYRPYSSTSGRIMAH